MICGSVANVEESLSHEKFYHSPELARVLERMKPWEIIADNLAKAGWTAGCVATVDCEGRTIFVADAHRCDGPALANSSIWSHNLDRSNLSSEEIRLCCEALGSFTEKISVPVTATSAM
jgi:hypothetical protein